MKRLERTKIISIIGGFFLCAVLLLFFFQAPSADAVGPRYQQYPELIYCVTTTADCDLLAAPGANYDWWIIGLGWSVLTVESGGTATVEDAAGTPQLIHTIPLDTVCTGNYFNFSEGIECNANSAVQVDFSGSTGELSLFIIGYKRRY